jgi:hypothetical protein
LSTLQKHPKHFNLILTLLLNKKNSSFKIYLVDNNSLKDDFFLRKS